MIKEIKFRAWHFGLQKMFSAEEMTRDQMALLPDGRFANIDGQDTSRSIIYTHEQMLPLQYIGLKDKSGKEIYEGDIVDYGNGGIEVDDAILGSFVYIQHHECGDVEECEVIGNIWENPELLK